MVLVGLGILFASLTFLVLRNPRWKWREAIEFWRSGKRRNADKVSAGRGNGDEDGEGNVDLKQTRNGEAREGGAETLKQSPPPGSATGSRNPGAQRSTPTLTLDNPSSTITSGTGLPSRQPATATALRDLSATPKQTATRSIGHEPSLTSTIAMRPPQASPTPTRSASLLMPPPPPRPSTLRPLPKLNNSFSLVPSPSLASTLRAPPRSSSTLSTALAATTSTLPPASRPSRKVILPPGHSPLDWAALTANPPNPTFLRGAALPPNLIRVPASLLKLQNGRKGRDAWGTWQGKVYNLTPYRKFHPGGEGELMRGAGNVGEAERLFMEVHPWVNWEGMLGECLVGLLVSEADAQGVGGGELEEMD